MPAGHAYDFTPPHARVGAGLKQDANTELSSQPVRRGHDPERRVHVVRRTSTRATRDTVWPLKVDPERDEPDRVAADLASQVLHGLRRAELIG